MDTDRNLLFAVLALQADLLDRERFVQACTLWAARKERPIADLLVDQGWLTTQDRADVERLLARKLRKHGGNVQASLAEAAGPPDVRDPLQVVTAGRVADGSLRRHAESFFQGNRFLVAALVTAVADAVPDSGEVLDLYAGVGLFAVSLAAMGHLPRQRRDREIGASFHRHRARIRRRRSRITQAMHEASG